MPKKLTTKEFKTRAREVHGNKYDYANVNYTGTTSKVKILCKNCKNLFEQLAQNHLAGSGCNICAMKIKKTVRTSTIKEFKIKARKVHGNKYDYANVKYKNSASKVTIMCKTCKSLFDQTPQNHLKGHGCNICAVNTRTKKQTQTTDTFIQRSKLIHGDKYDYKDVKYINNSTKVKIHCKNCNKVFSQEPQSHLKGIGCKNCAIKYRSDKQIKTTEEFKNDSIKIHGTKYNYKYVKYVNGITNVKILCNTCNKIFNQRPSTHLNGSGCPECYNLKNSRGAKSIESYLRRKRIKYIREKRFNSCKDKLPLPFDFYLPKHNTLIEFDGKQHFKPIKFFGGRKTLKDTKRRDSIKNQWAADNNIKLIRIRYDEDVVSKLDQYFG